jgi:hypothetical protein
MNGRMECWEFIWEKVWLQDKFTGATAAAQSAAVAGGKKWGLQMVI